MLSYHADALRARVRSDYCALVQGATDAARVDEIFELIMHATLSEMSAQLHQWNRSNGAETLPSEVLVACLANLDFRGRFRASHVSRYWRATALACPSLWADLGPSSTMGSNVKLLSMALARTAKAPLDLRIGSQPSLTIAVEPLVTMHAHHLRSLTWSADSLPAFLLGPLPILESLAFYHSLTIPENFLAGQANRFRTLILFQSVRFPSSSPALSAVTELRIFTVEVADAESLLHLFTLFPRLKVLALHELRSQSIQMLPHRITPPFLTTLSLAAREPSDLIPLYVAWGGRRLQHADLGMRGLRVGDLSWLLNGAIVLAMECEDSRTVVSTRGLRGKTRRLELKTYSGFMPEPLLRLFLQRGPLQHVCHLDLGSRALDKCILVLPLLPELRRITVHFEAESRWRTFGDDDDAPKYTFIWARLRCLTRLMLPKPEQFSLIIEANVFPRSRGPPNSDEARQLLDELALLKTFDMPTITIRGFPRAVDTDLARVEFDTETTVSFFWP